MSARVLVVDDDRDHAESVAEILEMNGYEVEMAFSGEEALDRFKAHEFDVTLMDVKLPGMNGVETYFEFRRLCPNTRVIMMTGFSVEQLVAQAVANGALGVLHKPFTAGDLLKAIDEAKPRGAVLVADDDEDLLGTVETILEHSGYRVVTAKNGEEALEKAQANGVDCLLLDMRMPVLTGLEVFLQLRNSGYVVPTVFVTAYGEDVLRGHALEQPHTSLLNKPIDPRVLLNAVEAVVGPKSRTKTPVEET